MVPNPNFKSLRVPYRGPHDLLKALLGLLKGVLSPTRLSIGSHAFLRGSPLKSQMHSKGHFELLCQLEGLTGSLILAPLDPIERLLDSLLALL